MEKNGVKIAIPLKYLSNFWRSLEMSLINSKVELSLNWIQKCVLTTAAIGANADDTGADSATFKITDASKTVCSCCYFFNRKQCKIRKTIKWKI